MSGGGGHGGGGASEERWLLTYADMITLLMVFFIVLYSMAQIDARKYQQVAESLHRAFGVSEGSVISLGIGKGGGESEAEPAPIAFEDLPPRQRDYLDISTELASQVSAAGLGADVSVTTNVEGILISVSESLLFAPGSTVLQSEAQATLDRIAAVLRPLPNAIRVVAYTDDVPTEYPFYISNWELSAARAVVIVRYLSEEAGIAPERLMAAGQAEYHPLFPNDTREHRARNRRAEIVVIYPMEHEDLRSNFVPGFPVPGFSPVSGTAGPTAVP